MQLSTSGSPYALLGLALVVGCARSATTAVEAAQSVYVRTDTDATTVVSPRTRVGATMDDGYRLDAAYSVDIWTGASVDVVAAATPAIHERRQELQAGGGYSHGDVSVSANYRFSSEPDYTSHSGVLSGSLDFAERNTTLAAALVGSGDTVGRSGDDAFRERQWSLGGRLTLTQVLGQRTLASVSWDQTRIGGFQASPYRWVAVGGDGLCSGTAPFCVPEQLPEQRDRQALSLRLRQAFPWQISTGGAYRFYFDSWGVVSHTLEPDVTWALVPGIELSLRYRYYAQSEADFYRPRYFDLSTGYLTRDRKLSALRTHGVSLGYVQQVAAPTMPLSLGAQLTLTRYDYLAFVGLEGVKALEVTAFVGVAFDAPKAPAANAPTSSREVVDAQLADVATARELSLHQ